MNVNYETLFGGDNVFFNKMSSEQAMPMMMVMGSTSIMAAYFGLQNIFKKKPNMESVLE
jgi:hypothetical protein